jgi:transaldolase
LDHISRRLITGGGLKRLIDEDGLGGVTSNPTIFDKAIAGSTNYDDGLHLALEADRNMSNRALAERLIVEDIQLAADVLRPVYDDSDGANGFVSLEVSPGSAHDTGTTVAEARHLWQVVARPNVMIKVPATVEGIPAVEATDRDAFLRSARPEGWPDNQSGCVPLGGIVRVSPGRGERDNFQGPSDSDGDHL